MNYRLTDQMKYRFKYRIMYIMKYLNVPLFLAALSLGLMFVYLYEPEYKNISVYPTPENVDKVLFQDKSETCHKFTAKATKCPSDKSQIMNYQVQN